MNFEALTYEVSDNVATITLNRPDKGNALNGQLIEELFEASILCAGDENVRAVVITGAGKQFCVGGDLDHMVAADKGAEQEMLRMATLYHQGLIRFSHMNAPVIMAVNGSAGGGGFSLALAGDIIMAADTAKFVSAYTASGLTPDGSGSYFLPKHVGLLRAKELFLTNRVLTATEAQDWGMVTRVVPADELATEARTQALAFASGPSQAYGGVKRLLATAYADPIEAQLDKESVSIAKMGVTEDGWNGIRSFLNRVKPVFKGR